MDFGLDLFLELEKEQQRKVCTNPNAEPLRMNSARHFFDGESFLSCPDLFLSGTHEDSSMKQPASREGTKSLSLSANRFVMSNSLPCLAARDLEQVEALVPRTNLVQLPAAISEEDRNQSQARTKMVRAEAIYRYRLKKAKRMGLVDIDAQPMWNHEAGMPYIDIPLLSSPTRRRVKYIRRSILASSRPRIHGRFQKKT